LLQLPNFFECPSSFPYLISLQCPTSLQFLISSHSPSSGCPNNQNSPKVHNQKDQKLTHPQQDGIVLFMSGIWWRPQLFSKKLKPEGKRKKQKWMAPGDKPAEIEVQLDNGETLTLVPEAVGDGGVFETEGEMRAVEGYESGEEEISWDEDFDGDEGFEDGEEDE
jgi:hypothetical protein